MTNENRRNGARNGGGSQPQMHAEEAPAVEIRGFRFAYPQDGGNTDVLAWPDMRIEQGAFCVLVGSTGCGKTTLLRSLKPELVPVGRSQGEVFVLGKRLRGGVDDDAAERFSSHREGADRDACEVSSANGRDAVCQTPASGVQRGASFEQSGFSPLESAQLIGYVMQDPSAQIVCDTVWHELAFGLENVGMPQSQMRRRVAEVAHFFGIEPWVRKKTEDLSGGQKQIVNLASVLALRPRLLLLDEPTAQLDPNAVKQFLFLLSRVNRELGITVVVATHSPEDVEAYCTQRIDLSDSLEPAPRAAAEAAIGKRRASRSEKLGSEIAIRATDLHFRFDRREPWVLRGIDLDIVRGSVHAIVGGNGCGKTTLLRCLAGVLKPQRGRMRNALANSQAMLPQDPKALFVCDSVAEELMEWSGRCGYTQAEVEDMAKRFGFESLGARHPYDLSGGQQQKLATAKLLLANPNVLFLDEPTKGLDPASCAELSRIVRGLTDAGKTIVLVTHDLDFALVTADFVSMPFDGEMACTEPVVEFFENNIVYCPNAKSRLFAEIAREGCTDE